MRAPVTMQEVPASEWRSFLERFGRAHRAWLGTMHRVSGYGNVTTAERVALESIRLDDHLSGKIVRLCFLEGPSIRVEEPRAVRIERNDRGAERALEIETAGRGLLRLAFRATALPEEVDGLRPAEVWPGRSPATVGSGCERATGAAVATYSPPHRGLRQSKCSCIKR
jgi:hypothetical protein